MKTTLLIIAGIAGIVSASFSQITLTQSDMPVVGKSYFSGVDTVAVVSAGATGSTSWSFANLQNHKPDTFSLSNPAGTPGFSSFSNATAAFVQTSGEYVYFTISASELSILGFYTPNGPTGPLSVKFDIPQKHISFPSTNGTQFGGTSKFTIAYAIPQPPVDSGKSVHTVIYSSIINAFGTLTTPTGTYNVLRQKYTEYNSDSSFVKAAGNWTFQNVSRDTSIKYNFYAKTIGFSVVEMDTAKKKTSYFLSSANTGINPVNSPSVFLFVYPNPVSETLNFEGEIPTGSCIKIYDISGKMLSAQTIRFANRMNIDISEYSDGLYLYRIVSSNGEALSSGKFNVVK